MVPRLLQQVTTRNQRALPQSLTRDMITQQGGEHVLYGSTLALAATTQTWATATDTPVAEIAHTTLR